jgi:hypothetical protein
MTATHREEGRREREMKRRGGATDDETARVGEARGRVELGADDRATDRRSSRR